MNDRELSQHLPPASVRIITKVLFHPSPLLVNPAILMLYKEYDRRSSKITFLFDTGTVMLPE